MYLEILLVISIVFEIARKEVICLRNLEIREISQFFANRRFSPVFLWSLKRPKSSLNSIVGGLCSIGHVFVKPTYTLVFTAGVCL
ncbi:MAG TPA: hypothetical protein VE544_08750, partial [Nitrososphaeraceae archaeon]|nr:hypothetical protein [Nitrososphaeraceae archaeon]